MSVLQILSRAGRDPGGLPTLVIAHRGFSGAAPENTLAAFAGAVACGADMIELDVHLSADGEVAVIHDDTLERTTSGSGLVADYPLAALRGFDAGGWFGREFAGEKIPALEEVLAFCKGKILVNIEIKLGYLGSYTMDDLACRTLAKVQEAGMLNGVLFSSFYPPALKRIKQENGRAEVALLLNSPWPESEEALSGLYPVLNCGRGTLSAETIEEAGRRGFILNVWTVNDEAEMSWFLARGVSGIITNHPDRLRALMGRTRGLAGP